MWYRSQALGKAELRLLNMALQQALEAELFGCDITGKLGSLNREATFVSRYKEAPLVVNTGTGCPFFLVFTGISLRFHCYLR